MTAAPAATPATALVFPGENGARAESLDPWLADPAGREVVAEVSEVVGRDVVAWLREPLHLTDPTAAHLAVVVTGVVGARSLARRGLRPVVVAGHGVGEFAALVVAGALALAQVVELVHWRAELLFLAPRPSRAGMAAAVGPGALDAAREALSAAGPTTTVVIACVDGPEQVLLTGGVEDLGALRAPLREAGVDLVRLAGRAPCHSAYMQPVVEHLATALADLDWSVPAVPVVPGADGWPTTDPRRLADCLRRQLTCPVLWESSCRALAAAGAEAVVEVGAAPVLGRLIRQNCPDIPVHLASGPGAPLPAPRPEPALAAPGPTRGER